MYLRPGGSKSIFPTKTPNTNRSMPTAQKGTAMVAAITSLPSPLARQDRIQQAPGDFEIAHDFFTVSAIEGSPHGNVTGGAVVSLGDIAPTDEGGQAAGHEGGELGQGGGVYALGKECGEVAVPVALKQDAGYVMAQGGGVFGGVGLGVCGGHVHGGWVAGRWGLG